VNRISARKAPVTNTRSSHSKSVLSEICKKYQINKANPGIATISPKCERYFIRDILFLLYYLPREKREY
jgi:hypothetical protein